MWHLIIPHITIPDIIQTFIFSEESSDEIQSMLLIKTSKNLTWTFSTFTTPIFIQINDPMASYFKWQKMATKEEMSSSSSIFSEKSREVKMD